MPVPSGGVAAPSGDSSGLPDELPLDWFSRLQTAISDVESELYFGYMERCMSEAGFSWTAPSAAPVPPEWFEITRYPIRYGTVTAAQADLAAYRSPEEVLFEEYSDGDTAESDLPSDPAELEAFQIAWFGAIDEAPFDTFVVVDDPISGEPVVAFDPSPVNRGGCQGRANEWLAGGERQSEGADVTTDLDAARAWIGTRTRAAFDDSLADERVISAANEWRTCMADRGWEPADWRFPGGLVVGHPDGPAISDEESGGEGESLDEDIDNNQLALDDVRCQEETDWLTSLRVVEAEYQQEAVERVPDLFADARELLEEYSARLALLRLEDLDQ